MREQTKVTGIILSVRSIGENDRTMTILTKERGKITVFARGCRRPNHPLFGVTQPLLYCEFMVSDTRKYTYLNSADCIDSFFFLKESLENIYYSSYFAEVAEYFTVEGQDERNILNLLFVTFMAIKKKKVPLKLIRRIFELKVLQFAGLGMQCFSCLCCGRQDNLTNLSLEAGGTFCQECGKTAGGRPVDPSVLYVLQYVSASPLESLYAFTLKEEISREFRWTVKRYFAVHVEHRFKSAQMLDEL
ncbi:MAG: DNA repair protein RecO [Eubacterium sp.]|nr:DNA repair protein RecO [Eubacterium sp.]MDD7209188.1 DNA repair protein RecO [Lachnospiraceae bacterium]MDY5497071.1 DNA repair protein RecO [Anaerobutyricum sp.]